MEIELLDPAELQVEYDVRYIGSSPSSFETLRTSLQEETQFPALVPKFPHLAGILHPTDEVALCSLKLEHMSVYLDYSRSVSDNVIRQMLSRLIHIGGRMYRLQQQKVALDQIEEIIKDSKKVFSQIQQKQNSIVPDSSINVYDEVMSVSSSSSDESPSDSRFMINDALDDRGISKISNSRRVSFDGTIPTAIVTRNQVGDKSVDSHVDRVEVISTFSPSFVASTPPVPLLSSEILDSPKISSESDTNSVTSTKSSLRKRAYVTRKSASRLHRTRSYFQYRRHIRREICASVLTSGVNERPFINVLVDKVEMCGLLDTGANISALGKGCEQFLSSCSAFFHHLPSVLSVANGSRERILGYVFLDVTFNGTTQKIKFHLVPNLSESLYLGMDFFRAFKMDFNISELSGDITNFPVSDISPDRPNIPQSQFTSVPSTLPCVGRLRNMVHATSYSPFVVSKRLTTKHQSQDSHDTVGNAFVSLDELILGHNRFTPRRYRDRWKNPFNTGQSVIGRTFSSRRGNKGILAVVIDRVGQVAYRLADQNGKPLGVYHAQDIRL